VEKDVASLAGPILLFHLIYNCAGPGTYNAANDGAAYAAAKHRTGAGTDQGTAGCPLFHIIAAG
jgi:hypothetical protein